MGFFQRILLHFCIFSKKKKIVFNLFLVHKHWSLNTISLTGVLHHKALVGRHSSMFVQWIALALDHATVEPVRKQPKFGISLAAEIALCMKTYSQKSDLTI